MKKSAGSILRVFFLLLISVAALGQKNAQLHWYFSQNNNAIFFDQNTLEPRQETIPNTLNIGQSAVASDLVTGELIFYTDGNRVYDKFHRLVTNGTGLQANQAGPQAVAISAVPGIDNLGQYYIFTNSATLNAPGNIRYSVYDTALYGAGGFPAPAAGDIDPAQKNQSIAGISDGTLSPAMLIVPNAAFDGFWLITHQRNSEDYQVTGIMNDGSIGATTTYNIPGAPQIAHTISYTDSTKLFNPNQLTLSIAPQDNRPVTLVSFDPQSGAIDGASARLIPNTDTSQLANQNIFDTEFSLTGKYLYISGNFDSAADSLMQVDLEDPTLTPVMLSTAGNMARSYGLQRGPDDRIYHLYENDDFRLGRINDPDSVAADAFYSRTAIGNNIFESRQFAAFLPLIEPQLELDFQIAGRCANSPVIFLPSIRPAADSVIWDFGDGETSNAWSPRHTYDQAGTFNVRLFAFSNGFYQDTSMQLTLQEFDLEITGVPQDTTVCPEDFPLELTAEAEGAGATFQWSNQETQGPTTSIDSAGNYYVVATAPNGCSTYAPTRVQEYGAQEQRAFVWYFGEHAGIDFNPISTGGAPEPIPYGDPTIYNGGNEMIAPEGCAIYCDPNGYPILYSDGASVYDREGTLVATLSGDPGATQSVMIMEYPGDASLYYIFTTQEVYDASGSNSYELHYSIFDIKQRNGLGDVIRDAAGNPVEEVLMYNSTERLTGNQQWLIAHEYGNNIFRAYRLTADGIQTPVISQIGSAHPTSTESAAHGYMRLSNTNTLAVALPLDGTNYIEVFDFIDSTGVITNFRQIDVGADFNVDGNIYGLEFSTSGRKIFGSLNGGSESYIVEYWLDSLNNPVPQPEEPFTSNLTLGALQVGPDGSIYVAADNQPFLGSINASPDTAQASQFQEQGFALAPGTNSLLGLPNFISQYGSSSTGASVTGSNGCPGEDILFEATGTSTFDTYTWNIIRISDNQIVDGPVITGPGSTSSHTFSTDEPGEYEATVFITNQCSNSRDTTLAVQFTVFAPPAMTLTSTDAGACGANDGQLEVTMGFTGEYHYTIRNTDGQILDAGFDVDDPVLSLDSLGSGVYTVFVIEQTNGCSNSESITINEDQAFEIDDSGTGNSNCEGEDGSISFSVDANAVLPVNYRIFNQDNNNQVVSGSTNSSDTTIGNIRSGTYYLELTDQNGCSAFLNDLEIQRPDTATLETDLFVAACDVSSYRIGARTPDGTEIIWTWDNNSFTGDSIDVERPGTYTVTARGDDINTCDNTKTVNVIFSTADPNPFRGQYTICPEDPVAANAVVRLFPGNRFIQSRYFTEDGTEIDESIPGFEFAGDTLLVYTLANITAELTNSAGCVTEAEIAILETCEARITVPNAFRPQSSNEENSAFSIYTRFIDADNFQILIFNRWGEIVFESNDPEFRWNGGKLNNPGDPAPQGTYAYIIRYLSSFEPRLGEQVERGGVVLLR